MTRPAPQTLPLADCPECGGWGNTGTDEVGALYHCYLCGTSGRVLACIAAAYEQAAIDRAERFAPARLGIHVRRMHSEWDWDEAPAPAAGHRLFTRLIDAPRRRAAAPSPFPDDDLPW